MSMSYYCALTHMQAYQIQYMLKPESAYHLVHATLRRLVHPALEALLHLHSPNECCHLACVWDSLRRSGLSEKPSTGTPQSENILSKNRKRCEEQSAVGAERQICCSCWNEHNTRIMAPGGTLVNQMHKTPNVRLTFFCAAPKFKGKMRFS